MLSPYLNQSINQSINQLIISRANNNLKQSATNDCTFRHTLQNWHLASSWRVDRTTLHSLKVCQWLPSLQSVPAELGLISLIARLPPLASHIWTYITDELHLPPIASGIRFNIFLMVSRTQQWCALKCLCDLECKPNTKVSLQGLLWPNITPLPLWVFPLMTSPSLCSKISVGVFP